MSQAPLLVERRFQEVLTSTLMSVLAAPVEGRKEVPGFVVPAQMSWLAWRLQSQIVIVAVRVLKGVPVGDQALEVGSFSRRRTVHEDLDSFVCPAVKGSELLDVRWLGLYPMLADREIPMPAAVRQLI